MEMEMGMGMGMVYTDMVSVDVVRSPRPPRFAAASRGSSRRLYYYTRGGCIGRTGKGRRRGAESNSERSAPDTHRDVCTRGETGVWELWTRVCSEGGGCEFFAAGAFGVRDVGRWAVA